MTFYIENNSFSPVKGACQVSSPPHGGNGSLQLLQRVIYKPIYNL